MKRPRLTYVKTATSDCGRTTIQVHSPVHKNEIAKQKLNALFT